ncbi:MTH1187 family thiamine-binding protein [Geovibrio thiophilus]|uniref:MTH1187 family thiamine-binding protein n=1 Tax=Geovibrio thiophilus TaxID=139438 RepID=A0A3R6AXS4_9BACT|nr:MTH1187 family thiamine-binding protein [Geovibrio thiophilus]QAR32958.1 MTH1187 family thiamine-binding protein [Geovibrio thiophilus]
MSAMAFVSITPLGEGESVSEYVARAVRVIKNSGLEWRLTPMGTIIEGENTAAVLGVVNSAVEELGDCNRISVSIKIDYRRGREAGMSRKVESVMEKIDL